MDVVRDQMTEDVVALFRTNNAWSDKILNNMTHLFQPIDLTVNENLQIIYEIQTNKQKGLSDGKRVEDIEIIFLLTVIKSLHAKQLMAFYNHMTSEGGSKVIINGQERAEILYAIRD